LIYRLFIVLFVGKEYQEEKTRIEANDLNVRKDAEHLEVTKKTFSNRNNCLFY